MSKIEGKNKCDWPEVIENLIDMKNKSKKNDLRKKCKNFY